MTPAAQLDAGLVALGIDLPAERRQRLLDFATLLAKWNKTYNLTALRRPDQAVSYHLLDSLAILPYLDGVGSLLDVGSGGGLPGIPLAIARPDLRVALIDSNSKKVAFLRQVAIELGLPNVAAHCDRIEAWRGDAGFEAITSRAFSELSDFVSLSRHCLAPGGRWLAMKGQRPEDEIGRLPADVRVVAVHRLTVPGVEGERHLVDIREAGATRNDNG